VRRTARGIWPAAPSARAALAFGVAALVGLVRPPAAAAEPAGLPVPPGCALGIGGPALRDATSVSEARDAAFAALAAERLPVHVASEVGWSDARLRELSSERASGRLRGVYVAALRRRPDGRVDAVVCGAEIDPDTLPGRGVGGATTWPRRLERRRGCGLGIAGVDLDALLRARSARTDALEMLARELETEVHHALHLHGGRRVERDHRVGATPTARAAIEAIDAELDEASWLDRRGRGPLGLPGVLYLQLCLPDP
jgi:hypothetical protein